MLAASAAAGKEKADTGAGTRRTGVAGLVEGEALVYGTPDFGFEPAVAAEEPLIVDEGIDEGALGGSEGAVLEGELGFEPDEVVVVLVGDDDAFGVEAGFERVAG